MENMRRIINIPVLVETENIINTLQKHIIGLL